jgi:3-oxoacyl-[acyl-carrier-protein] synthase III
VTGDETLRELSIQAAQKALEMAQVKADDVDLVLLCTSTPDDLFGGATQVLCNLYSSINSCNWYLQPLFFLNISKRFFSILK